MTLKKWLFSTNHKEVGLLYIMTSLLFLFIGGAFALLMRTQLATTTGPAPSDYNLIAPTLYNQLVTVHGLLMIFWVLSPLAIGLANYFVPLQIGARDLAFPRLNALSYWLYLFSGIGMVSSFAFGSAPDLGWTLYSPQTSWIFSPFLGLNVGAAALLMLAASITLGSVNFVVTIFKMRAPGLKMKYLSPFTWGILVTIMMMLYAFPSLIAAVILLFTDRQFGTLYLSSIQPSGSLLWDNVFWFFGHPEVYIVLFPAIGVIGDILPVFTRRPLYGAKYVIMAIIAAAVISFIVWGHHMFVTGIDPGVTKLYTVTTIAVSLPFDVVTISMIETLYKGKIRFKAPALFAIGAIGLFVIGGITGVFLASIALDHELRGTYFVVAHFHYIMVGAGILGLIGGLYYWFPKITGRMYNETMARIHFVISFVGFNVLYFPMFLLYDMPRRIASFIPQSGWGTLNQIATVGAFVFGFAQILLLFNLWRSIKVGFPVGPNPWEGSTLEWSTPSPPPAYNFETIPTVSSDGTINFGHSSGSGPLVGNGHSNPQQTHLSQWPIVMGLSTLLFLLGLTASRPPPNYFFLVPGVALGVYALYGYGKETFVVHDEEGSESWPFQKVSKLKLGVWAFLASEIIFFGVLLGAYFFVRVNAPAWPAVGTIFDIQHGFANTLILLTSSLTVVMAVLAARNGSSKALTVSLIATIALGIAFLYNKAMEWQQLFQAGIFKNYPLAASTYYVTTGVHGVHVFAGLLLAGYLTTRAVKGRYLKENYSTVQHFGLYWHFVDIVWIFLFPLFYLL